jgi:uncharacterized protein (DUF885 family)
VATHEDEMARIGRAELGTGDLAALRARVDTDPAYRFHSKEELLAFSTDAVARAKAVLPKWFGRLPKTDAVIRPQPAYLGAAPDQYNSAAQDGSRSGMFMISLDHPEKKLRSKAEVTAFHEVYPGYHLQIALAQEQPGAHPISQLVGTTAFVEGWGRYAEQLAEEMGLYTTPFARIGQRSWPGHGMVVDPGVHVFGWSRDSAISSIRNGEAEGDGGPDRGLAGAAHGLRHRRVGDSGAPGRGAAGAGGALRPSPSSTTRCWPTGRSRCR